MAESTEELSRVKAEDSGVPSTDVRVHPDPEPAGAWSRTDHPTVIVDDLHIVYRVNGARRPARAAPPPPSAACSSAARSRPAVRKVHAVRGVTFAAYRGEAIGLIGSNGSGKSTLLRAIAGLLPAEHGNVYTDGQPSLLGVNAALMNDLTGERNVVLGGLAMGMSREEVRERYQEHRRLLRHQREGRLHHPADAHLLLRHGAPGCASPSPRPRTTTSC